MNKTPPNARKVAWEKQLSEDFQWLAGTPQGRRILSWMFGWGQVYQEIDETDPIRLAMAVGQNNFAKKIAQYCTLRSEIFTMAMSQNNDVAREMLGTDEYDQMMRHLLGLQQAQTRRMDS